MSLVFKKENFVAALGKSTEGRNCFLVFPPFCCCFSFIEVLRMLFTLFAVARHRRLSSQCIAKLKTRGCWMDQMSDCNSLFFRSFSLLSALSNSSLYILFSYFMFIISLVYLFSFTPLKLFYTVHVYMCVYNQAMCIQHVCVSESVSHSQSRSLRIRRVRSASEAYFECRRCSLKNFIFVLGFPLVPAH